MVLAPSYEKIVLSSFPPFLSFLTHSNMMRKLEAFTITYFTFYINLAISTAYLFSTYRIVLTFDFFVVYIEFHIVTILVAFVVYYTSLLL